MDQINKYSRIITQDPTQGASQAMLFATGLNRNDFNKAQIGIASMWYDGNPCNMHLLDLANHVREGVLKENLLPMRFNTIGVSDGISMGTDGMSYSLQSRDLIADSIETIMAAQWYDALITIPGCDKNMPGCLMAMARLNRPSLMIYGGTIEAGRCQNESLDVVSAFQAYGRMLSGEITDAQREEILQKSCPGAGACGGMYTANTMASAIEALGMSLPYSSSYAAVSQNKIEECHQAGQAIKKLLSLDLKPRDIMTKESFKNAFTLVIAMGGSTNAVLHLIAMAKSAGIDFTLDDCQTISNNTPMLADFRPSGTYVMADLQQVGGTPAVMKYLLEQGLLNGDCLSVTGQSLRENMKQVACLKEGQKILQPVEKPIKKTGHIQILKGNLAPEGSVAKITGKEGLQFSGPAQCFDSEEEMIQACLDKTINKGSVIVIRYEGPKGGPGMPEMLKPTSMIMGAGLGKDVALITDGRFSGGSHGFIIGHIAPEAQDGGPIALLKNGDIIHIDAENNSIAVNLSTEEWEIRRKNWQAPKLKATQGTLYKYIKTVSSASQGCVTDQ